MNRQQQVALCGKMCRTLGRADVTEHYDLAKILSMAYERLNNPRLIARLLVAVEPLVPELCPEGHELARRLGFKAMGKPMPAEASLGAYNGYDDGYYDDDVYQDDGGYDDGYGGYDDSYLPQGSSSKPRSNGGFDWNNAIKTTSSIVGSVIKAATGGTNQQPQPQGTNPYPSGGAVPQGYNPVPPPQQPVQQPYTQPTYRPPTNTAASSSNSSGGGMGWLFGGLLIAGAAVAMSD